MAKKLYQIDAGDEVILTPDLGLNASGVPVNTDVLALFSSGNTSLGSTIRYNVSTPTTSVVDATTVYTVGDAYAVGDYIKYSADSGATYTNYVCTTAVASATDWATDSGSFTAKDKIATTVADFAISTIDSTSKAGCTINFPAARSDGKARDFVIRYVCGVAPTFPTGITVESDTAFSSWDFTAGKTYYISFTETASGVWLGGLKEMA